MSDRRADDRLPEALSVVRQALEAHRRDRPYWEGRLSTSALATATAVSALAAASRAAGACRGRCHKRIRSGLEWLASHQNDDGGWGDTPRSKSNLSTTALVLAAIRLSGTGGPDLVFSVARGEAHVERQGGLAAIRARYGDDRTFSVPILTNCALAGLVNWREVDPLPFELAALPRRTFRWLGLTVVSYALPALIAVGLARFVAAAPRNPLRRFLRHLAVRPSLRRLCDLIPASGGFLEAAPLTAFVVMGLCAAQHGQHPAVARGLAFLEGSQRPDGGWPIDSNLSVWNTTHAVNALGGGEAATRDWLLARQQRERHPFTDAAPGGWGWSHLPGSVPDADDTAGALLALSHLPASEPSTSAVRAGLRWLLDLQNRGGGWPTFCRGWQRLPFDRSAPDLTAHTLRALAVWRDSDAGLVRRIDRASRRALAYLARAQRSEGSWLPLWFGHEDAPDKGNPVVGTSRVLAAYRDLRLLDDPPAARGANWLWRAQNADGSWGGDAGVAGSIEETALACEALLPFQRTETRRAAEAGLGWLCRSILDHGMDQPRPIGLYFARLWYAEDLYPLVFAASALGRALCRTRDDAVQPLSASAANVEPSGRGSRTPGGPKSR